MHFSGSNNDWIAFNIIKVNLNACSRGCDWIVIGSARPPMERV